MSAPTTGFADQLAKAPRNRVAGSRSVDTSVFNAQTEEPTVTSFIKFRADTMCCAFMLATMSDCQPAPPPLSTLDTDVEVAVAGHDDNETTAAVISPGWNKLCPNGRVIISSGDRLENDPAAPPFPLPRGTLNFPTVLVRNLDGQGGSKEVSLPAPTPLGDYNLVTADSQLVRLANDDVVLIFGVAVKTVPADGEQLKVLNDGGATWNRPTVVLSNDSADYPVAMTSLPPNKRHPEGRLFAFRCLYGTGEPRLYWSDDQWKTLAGSSSVYYGGSSSDPEVMCFEGFPMEKLPGGAMRFSGGISISRVKSDKPRDWVRVAYASATATGRQVERVVLVEIERKSGSSQETVKTEPSRTITGGDVLYATFIEPDHVELKDDDVNAAVLYWAEAGPNGDIVMRYGVVKGGGADSVGEWSEPGDLSVQAGQRRTWVMEPGTVQP